MRWRDALYAEGLSATATDHSPSADRLPQRLGFWTAVAIVAGNVIGSGIFRVPSTVATEAGSIVGIALVWIAGGAIALCGALALAELAAAFPRAGGVYVYLREAYGPLVAFLFGWITLLTQPVAAAAIALVFAEYFGSLAPLSPLMTRAVAAGMILVFGIIGYRSVRGAGAVQGIATIGKLGGLFGLVVFAFLLDDGTAGAFASGRDRALPTLWSGLGVALVAALWAYNGWQDVSFVGSEVREPQRTLPRALLAGTAVVTVAYLAANAAFLYVLPLDALRASPLVATDVASRLLGNAGSAAVAALVMTSTLGSLNGITLVTPRVFYAMAGDGVFFRSLAAVHPRYGTPHVAITFYIALALLCVATRTFEQLIEAFVLGVWPFLALAVGAVFILRRRRPELPRPYRTAGYPMVPAIFLAAVIGVVAATLIQRPTSTFVSLGIIALGLPVYWLWRAASHSATKPPSAHPSIL